MERLTNIFIINVIIAFAIGYGGYYFFFRPQLETPAKIHPKTNLNAAQTLSEAEPVVRLPSNGLAVRFSSAATPERM